MSHYAPLTWVIYLVSSDVMSASRQFLQRNHLFVELRTWRGTTLSQPLKMATNQVARLPTLLSRIQKVSQWQSTSHVIKMFVGVTPGGWRSWPHILGSNVFLSQIPVQYRIWYFMETHSTQQVPPWGCATWKYLNYTKIVLFCRLKSRHFLILCSLVETEYKTI